MKLLKANETSLVYAAAMTDVIYESSHHVYQALKVGAQLGGILGSGAGILTGLLIGAANNSLIGIVCLPMVGSVVGFYGGSIALGGIAAGATLGIDVTKQYANWIYS